MSLCNFFLLFGATKAHEQDWDGYTNNISIYVQFCSSIPYPANS